MADATERKQIGRPSALAGPDTGTKSATLAGLVSRKTPALPNDVTVHGDIGKLTFLGTGFDASTAT